MGKIKDLTGQRFGKLVAKEMCGRNKYNIAIWLCDCDCGNTIKTTEHSLKTGMAKSCGCSRKSEFTIVKSANMIGISNTSFQDIKNRLGFKGKLTKTQLDIIEKEVEEIRKRYEIVTLYTINRYWNYVREVQEDE